MTVQGKMSSSPTAEKVVSPTVSEAETAQGTIRTKNDVFWYQTSENQRTPMNENDTDWEKLTVLELSQFY